MFARPRPVRLKHRPAVRIETSGVEGKNRPSIPSDARLFVWTRDRGACCNCGARTELQLDHVIPLALGGTNVADNLELLCRTCNLKKGASLLAPRLERVIA